MPVKKKVWEHFEEIKKLYESGASKDEIARLYSVSQPTINSILKKGGVRIRGVSESKLLRTKSLEDRFWANVDKTETCWLWTGWKDGKGYGKIHTVNSYGPVISAHRLSWELHNGKVEDKSLNICHKCDVPACVNPSHLFLGTTLDNIRDKVSKGRQPHGEKTGGAILTREIVLNIRRRYYKGDISIEKLGKEMSISSGAIASVVMGKSWAWLKSDDPECQPPATPKMKSKLTEKEVLEIRRLWATGKFKCHEIASKFGVSRGAINGIVYGQNWAWLK
jgi:predicted DNA-binding protein YlxM (UPF0122 family)